MGWENCLKMQLCTFGKLKIGKMWLKRYFSSLHFSQSAISILDLLQATSEGHRVLLSSPWYLNYISYGIDWPKYYLVEPQDFGGSEAEQKLVIGGEVSVKKWIIIKLHSYW